MKSYVVVFASCAVLGAAALAGDGPKTDASAKPKVTAAERIAALGGFVSYPGSQKGSIAFIDTQGVIDVSGDFDEIFGHFRRQIPVKLGLSRAKPGAPKALRTGAGADFAIIFISSDMEPPTVVVPEERYAVVNFAKYAVGLKLPTDEAKYRRRCAKAAL